MRKSLKAVLVATVVSAGVFGAQTLVAHEGPGGMMGGGSMMGQGGGTMGMMGNMMGQMTQMMDGCNKMMQDHQHGDSQKPVQTPTKEGEKQGAGDIMEMMGRMNVMRTMSQMVGTWK